MSPTERQVSHALLTRSPLNLTSLDRSRIPLSPVRLACVRHAASVRPEPGSNSQKFVSKQPLGCSNQFLNNLSSKFTQEFRWLLFDLHRLNNPFKLSKVFLFVSHYSIYKVQPSAAANFYNIAQKIKVVNNFFAILKNFFCQAALPGTYRSSGSLTIVSLRTFLVKHFSASNYFYRLNIFVLIYQSSLRRATVPCKLNNVRRTINTLDN